MKVMKYSVDISKINSWYSTSGVVWGQISAWHRHALWQQRRLCMTTTNLRHFMIPLLAHNGQIWSGSGFFIQVEMFLSAICMTGHDGLFAWLQENPSFHQHWSPAPITLRPLYTASVDFKKRCDSQVELLPSSSSSSRTSDSEAFQCKEDKCDGAQRIEMLVSLGRNSNFNIHHLQAAEAGTGEGCSRK